MYKVYLDDKLLYYPNDNEYCITEPIINLALNDAGTFEFGLPVSNPLYEQINKRKSMVRVDKDGDEIFYGEVRESEKDMYGTKQVYCVGELAFLFDSIQPQKKYQYYTVTRFLESLINEHNSQVEERKKFEIGIVTVIDSNDSIYRFTNRETTLDAIREKLCDRLNGYVKIRKENGIRYLDFLTIDDYGKKCNQAIEFGSNLLEYAENISASDIATAVIPLGAKLDKSPIESLEAYTTIESVNDGKDFLYIPEAVEKFGWVRVVKKFDDVTKPSILKRKGEHWLKSAQYENVVLKVKAVDLSITDDKLDQINIGDSVHSLASVLGMDTWFPVQKLIIPLQNPENQIIELGNTSSKSYTQQSSEAGKYQLTVIEQVRNDMESAVNNATQIILGGKGGYKISEYDENGLWVRDLYMDTPNKDDAVNILQITNVGIGFSRNGYNGPYHSAWTLDGSFVADFITTGTLNANLIKTGKIVGNKNPNVCFDVDNGIISGSSIVDPKSTVKAEIAQRYYDGGYYRGFIIYDKKDSNSEFTPIGGISRSWYSTDTNTPAVTFYGNDNVYFQSHGNGNRNNVLGMEKIDGVGRIFLNRAIGENEEPAIEQEQILWAGESELYLRKYINQSDTFGYMYFTDSGTVLGYQQMLSGNPVTRRNYIFIESPEKNGNQTEIKFVVNDVAVAGVDKNGLYSYGVHLNQKIQELEQRISNLENKQ